MSYTEMGIWAIGIMIILIQVWTIVTRVQSSGALVEMSGVCNLCFGIIGLMFAMAFNHWSVIYFIE